MAKKKSSLKAYFIDTTPAAAETWKSLGKGVTALPTNMNPQVTTETYINEDNATSSVDAYQATKALDITLWDSTSAPAHAFLDAMRVNRAVGADAMTNILEVDLDGESPYPATKSAAVVAIDTFNVEGGKPQRLGVTIYENGDPVQGTVTITAGVPTFTAS